MHKNSGTINVLNVNIIKQIVNMLNKNITWRLFCKAPQASWNCRSSYKWICHSNLGTLHVHTLLVVTCHKVKLTYFIGRSVVSIK